MSLLLALGIVESKDFINRFENSAWSLRWHDDD